MRGRGGRDEVKRGGKKKGKRNYTSTNRFENDAFASSASRWLTRREEIRKRRGGKRKGKRRVMGRGEREKKENKK